MRTVLTNHELPVCMLTDYNLKYNDYDFVLYHLFIKDKEYREYFMNLRRDYPNRMMILDNSAYEMYVTGESFYNSRYIDVIVELRPDYYIIPDALMDKETTISMFDQWTNNTAYTKDNGTKSWESLISEIDRKCLRDDKSKLTPQPMCVPQGRTIKEFFECLDYMYNKLKCEICIPFHNDFFYSLGSEDTADTRQIIDVLWGDCDSGSCRTKFTIKDLSKDDKYAVGRCIVMNMLADWEIDNERLHYHILGTHNPRELKYISQFDGVDTYNTDYPVKLAISKGPKLGLEDNKPEIIIDNFFDLDLNICTVQHIIYNINTLRKYIKNE